MRPSLLTLVALLAAAAACLEHAGAEPATPRRSLTTTGPSSDDLDWCWESLLTLGFCKDDFVASFLAGRPAPRECCLAADEAVHHCGPLTRAFLGLILPRGLLAQCAHQAATGGAPVTRPSQRRAPPRAPTLETGPRASGGTHGSPPEVSVREESPPEPKVIVAGGGGRARRAPGAPPAAGATLPLQKGVPAARPGAKGPPAAPIE
ncbi:unnamed protein product [Urochloa humidicola]